MLEILDRRIDYLVRSRYTTATVSHRDLLPTKIQKTKIGDYLYARARRPRDIIAFFNACIAVSEGTPKVTAQDLRRAEGEYSRSRLRALADEWNADYPHLIDFAAILRGQPASFKIGSIPDDQVREVCLAVAISDPIAQGILEQVALKTIDLLIPPGEALILMIRIFYRIGLVGLKLAPHESVSWVDELGRSISAAEIGPETSVVVHHAFHRALGIRP